MSRMTVKEWMLKSPISLPWHGKETGFTLETVRGHCPDCKGELVDIRGDVYESFGVVEMNMGGICPKCDHFVPMRSRVYPNRMEFAQIEDKGKWVRYKMKTPMTRKQVFWREFRKAMVPAMGGMTVAIVMSLVGSNPTKRTYFAWGVTVLGFTGLAVFVGWMMSRRK